MSQFDTLPLKTQVRLSKILKSIWALPIKQSDGMFTTPGDNKRDDRKIHSSKETNS